MKEEIMREYQTQAELPPHHKKKWGNTYYDNEVLQKWNNVKQDKRPSSRAQDASYSFNNHRSSVKIAVSGSSRNSSRKGSDPNTVKYHSLSNRGSHYMLPTKSSISKLNIK